MLLPALEHIPQLGVSLIFTLPPVLRGHFIATLLGHALQRPLRSGELDFLDGKWLLLKVSDAGLAVGISVENGRLVCRFDQQADVRMEADALTLAQMACKTVDPDTLFFRRKLSIRGDTDLGLQLKNLIDDIELDNLPLWARVPLQEFARRTLIAG